jgi:hypothetical protein
MQAEELTLQVALLCMQARSRKQLQALATQAAALQLQSAVMQHARGVLQDAAAARNTQAAEHLKRAQGLRLRAAQPSARLPGDAALQPALECPGGEPAALVRFLAAMRADLSLVRSPTATHASGICAAARGGRGGAA